MGFSVTEHYTNTFVFQTITDLADIDALGRSISKLNAYISNKDFVMQRENRRKAPYLFDINPYIQYSERQKKELMVIIGWFFIAVKNESPASK